ncbi:MAG: hypothetical protein ACRDD1_00660, partial [Planctomycetia bacterium]
QQTVAAKREWFYTPEGYLNTYYDRNGKPTIYKQFDKFGRHREIDYNVPFYAYTHLAYDKFGRLTSNKYTNHVGGMTGDRSIEETYEYDNLGRVKLKISFDPNAPTASRVENVYEYDQDMSSVYPGSSLTTRVKTKVGASTAPKTFETERATDTLGRLLTVRHLATGGSTVKQASFAYDDAGRVLAIDRSQSGVSGGPTDKVIDSTFAYDGAGRLDLLSHHFRAEVALPANAPDLATYNFAYDTQSRITNRRIDSAPAPISTGLRAKLTEIDTFGYDAAGRLRTWNSNAADGPTRNDFDLPLLDAAGNRTAAQPGTAGGFVVGAGNRLQSAAGEQFEYDKEGNLLR